MFTSTWRVLLALALAAPAASIRRTLETQGQRANPIRKVVRLLQDLEKKIITEGEEGEELYKKYTCYCKSNGKEVAERISAAEAKIPNLGPDVEAAKAEQVQLDEDVEKAKANRAAAKASVANTTATREKEAAAFAKEKSESDTNLAAMKKAIDALRAGSYGGFLQTGAAVTLRKVLSTSGHFFDDTDMDMSAVLSFLTGTQKQGADYAPQSGIIIGTLEQLLESMTEDLKVVVDAEAESIQAYEAVMKANKKEIASNTEAIERKMARSAELGVSIVNMENDLADMQASLLDDKKFVEDLEATCANKTAEWEEATKTRKLEQKAIAETIQMLNSDDSLEIFKSTLPSAAASFVQITGAGVAKARALEILGTASKGYHGGMRRMDFIGLALRGKAVGFDKVIKMIDNMINMIKEEQVADANKKDYCLKEVDSTEDKIKKLGRQTDKIQKAIADTEDGLKVVTEKIATVTQSIAELDQEVKDATEQRKAENELFVNLIRDDTAAKQLLGMAKNRLNKFYTPQLYTTTTTTLAPMDKISAAYGGTVLAQVATMTKHSKARQQSEDRPPAPEGPVAYSKKNEESTGVIAMIDLLVKDLDTELTEAETKEKNDQEDYDELMKDSKEKRAADSKTLTDSVAEKAELEADLKSNKDAENANIKQTQATLQVLAQLHTECDWLLENYNMRSDARTSEMGALTNAKAVLNGANYALLQSSTGKVHQQLHARALQQAL